MRAINNNRNSFQSALSNSCRTHQKNQLPKKECLVKSIRRRKSADCEEKGAFG